MARGRAPKLRRLQVVMPVGDFGRLKGRDRFYAALRSLELLQSLGAGPDGATSIVRLRPKDPSRPFEELARNRHANVQLLHRSGDSFTCLMRTGRVAFLRQVGVAPGHGYFVPPLELDEDSARVTFVGSRAAIARFLSLLRRRGLHYRTVSISDLGLSQQSPLNALTDQQRRVVRAAYERGYYDRPRRVSSKALAESLGMSSSTLVNHRLKAERRLLSSILGRPPDVRSYRSGRDGLGGS
jgi:hypothetical protein